jgi:predicted acylesterase/phospholipase RssA
MTPPQPASFSLDDARIGNLGLALSGGGFRSSLFHIGVLAQLADLDLLRYVGTISTVSGGSIIGAFYQLKVKQLLEGRRVDKLAPSAQAFRQLVKEIERGFVEAIQHNLRISTFDDRNKNARMLGNSYTSTQRIAELFEEHFFCPISGKAKNGLPDLLIDSVFEPGKTDSHQAFVVPQLVLNSTALNTGHLFQFTGRYIGEDTVNSVLGGISPMSNLKRLYLEDKSLTDNQRARLDHITVGDAVTASSCVPGLLNPFKLSDLYRDDEDNDVTVRLVDGGVFDNQGLVSLFEAGCTHFICSDATDLLSWDSNPAERLYNVLVRTNDIMMDRVRSELVEDLVCLGSDKYVVFTLGDLDGPKVFSREATRMVSALAHIRTDLDAFSNNEASALMYYGFMLSGHTLNASSDTPEHEPESKDVTTADGHPSSDSCQTSADEAVQQRWPFESVREAMDDPASRKQLLKQLELGSRSLWKVFHMGNALPYVLAIVPLLIPIALIGWLISALPPVPTTAWALLGLIMLSVMAYNQNARVVRWLDQIETLRRFRLRLAIALKPLGVTMVIGMFLATACRFYLRVFNPLFLRYGSTLQANRIPQANRKPDASTKGAATE